jgi:hypothetical protein
LASSCTITIRSVGRTASSSSTTRAAGVIRPKSSFGDEGPGGGYDEEALGGIVFGALGGIVFGVLGGVLGGAP